MRRRCVHVSITHDPLWIFASLVCRFASWLEIWTGWKKDVNAGGLGFSFFGP